MLSQYDYSMEYQRTFADALSPLPVGPDTNFDSEEEDADVDTVHHKDHQSPTEPYRPRVLAKESAKDPVIANVIQGRLASKGQFWVDVNGLLISLKISINYLTHSLQHMGAFCMGPGSLYHLHCNVKCSSSCILAYEAIGTNSNVLAQAWFKHCVTNAAINAPHVLKIRSCQPNPQTSLGCSQRS